MKFKSGDLVVMNRGKSSELLGEIRESKIGKISKKEIILVKKENGISGWYDSKDWELI